MVDRPQLGFIGIGRVGGALALALHHAGYVIAALHSRTSTTARAIAQQVGAPAVESAAEVAGRADLVFITTEDSAIAPVCRQVAESAGWRSGQAVVHCAGALGREALASAAAQGASTGGLHPLQTLPSVEHGLARLPGSVFTIEAEEPLREVLYRMARDLGGHPLDLDGENRALYHAAAVFTANYTVTLFAAAVRLLEQIDVDPEMARMALLPLLRGAVDSLAQEGLPGALTGPIARGDAETVARHIQALAGGAPDLVPLYRALAAATLPLAAARGLDQRTVERVRAALREAAEDADR